jgi:hypothetical protein
MSCNCWTQGYSLPVYQLKRLLLVQLHKLFEAQLFDFNLCRCYRATSSLITHYFTRICSR